MEKSKQKVNKIFVGLSYDKISVLIIEYTVEIFTGVLGSK